MAGLRRAIFLTAAFAAVSAMPGTGHASDDSVSIADAPGGTPARTRAWTTPPPGQRAQNFRTPPPASRAVRPAPRAIPRAPAPRAVPRAPATPTPRWIDVTPRSTNTPGASAPAAAAPAPEDVTFAAPPPATDVTPMAPPRIVNPPSAADAPAMTDNAPIIETPAQPVQRNGQRRRGVQGARTATPTMQFRFAVGDEILISIWDDDVETGTIDLRQRILRDGTISPLWLDPIHVKGRTIAELRHELVEEYKVYYKIPRITVGVESVHLERAFVLGEVVEPSAITLNGPQTLLQVLSQAGGIVPTLGSETVRIIRPRGPGVRPRIYTVNTCRSTRGRGARSFMVLPGDVVYVHPTGLANWNRTLNTALSPMQTLFGATGGAAATYLAIKQITDGN